METSSEKLVKVLNWEQMDFEQRLGIKGAKYTDVNMLLSFIIGLILAAITYGIIALGYFRPGFYHQIYLYFYGRGPTQEIVVLLTCWSAMIMFVKWKKLQLQRRSLDLMVVPHARDFVLAPATAPQIIERMYGLVNNPKHFVLLNRIERALSNLKNIGVISDVSEIMKSQAQNDEDQMETSYAFIKGFIWAIPVLGFIGTVVGLSVAIGQFGEVLQSADSMANIKGSLQGVTKGLCTAFDTTSLALVCALIIQLIMIVLKRKEELFLDDCKEYCHSHIIAKLRLIPTEPTDPSAAQ